MKNIKITTQRWLSIVLIATLIVSWFPAKTNANELGENELDSYSVELEESKDSGEKEEVGKKSDNRIEDEQEEQTKEKESDAVKDDSDKSTSDDKKKNVIKESSDAEKSKDNKKLSNDLDVEENKEEKEEESKDIQVTKEKINISSIVDQSIEDTKKYYENNPINYNEDYQGSHSDYWEFSALWSAGYKDLETDFPWKDSNPWSEGTYWTIGKNDKASMANEEIGIIIGSLLIGKDPYNFGDRNIVEDLLDRQNEDGMFSTIWGEAWALVALELIDADYDQNKHIQAILDKQSDKGLFGDGDATGWTMTALAPYMDQSDVKQAIDKSIEWAHGEFQNNDEFPGMFGPNANSTASVVMGLAAVGEDLSSDKWTKESGSLIEDLLEYQQDDGSFWWQKDSAGAVGMATEQALLALATVQNGQSTFINLKNSISVEEKIEKNVKFRVEGTNKTIHSTNSFDVQTSNDVITVFDATEQILDDAGIPFEGASTYISKIGDEEQAMFGGWDGWQYMVNGIHPDIDIGSYEIEDGDEIVWFYGNVGDIYTGESVADTVEKLTLRPVISLPDTVQENESFEVKVTSTYNVYNEYFDLEKENEQANIKDALVHYNGKTYSTNADGIATIPAKDVKTGQYEVRVTKDVEGSYPRLLRQSKMLEVQEKEQSEKVVTPNKKEPVSVSKDEKLIVKESKASIILPEDLPENTKVTVSVPTKEEAPYKEDELKLSGELFNFKFDYETEKEYQGKFQLTLGVDQAVDLDKAAIYYFDEENKKWDKLKAISKDAENHTITVEVEHFSIYGVFVDAVKTEDDGTEDDGTEDDGTEDDGTEDGGTEDDGTEDDGTEDSGTEDNGTEDGGTEDGGTEDDGTEDDGTEDDGTEDDDTKVSVGSGDNDDSSKVTDESKGEQSTQGSDKLPSTATNMFNMIYTGLAFLLSGLIVLWARRDNKVKNN